VFYAWGENVVKLKLKPYVVEGAATVTVDGLLDNASGNRQNMFAGGVISGLFGGLLTTLFEVKNNGYEYQLATLNGDLVSVIVEEQAAQKGQCKSVSVTRTKTTTTTTTTTTRIVADVRIRLEPTSVSEEVAKEYPQL
jgi:hypothetical protein